jgi:putative tricarboxylic transport membrane protein
MRQSALDLVFMYVIGVIGVIMRRFDFPVAPVIIGMILGPMSEVHLRRALSISQGDWLVFLKQPIACVFIMISVLVLFVPMLLRRRGIRLAEDD